MCFVFNINMVTFEGPPAMLNKRDQKVNSSTTTSSPIELLVNSVSSFAQKKFYSIEISTDSNESSGSSDTCRQLSEMSVIPQVYLGIEHPLIFLYCILQGLWYLTSLKCTHVL